MADASFGGLVVPFMGGEERSVIEEGSEKGKFCFG